MTVSGIVERGEGGRLRLYALSPDAPEAAALRAAFLAEDPHIGTMVGSALGTRDLDAHWLTLVPVADLKDIGFATYLRSGHDVPDDQIAAARIALESATGHVLIVQSPAFNGAEATLAPAEWLLPLAEFDTIRDPGPRRDTPCAASPAPVTAQGTTTPTRPRRTLGPKVLLSALVVAGLLIAALAMIGGR
ncbi:hypothetical protein G5B39_07100 [Rhodobacteraceae bacterium SC52]|nr:hypothetical protein G5B39_07100 [Rhodobacteraceae bacterium SC52]